MVSSRNDDGLTALMVAAAGGKDKSMNVMLEMVRRIRNAAERSEYLDAADGGGRTALMLAAVAGRLECVDLLKGAGARLDLKDDEGYTARARAEWAGKQAVVDLLDGKAAEEGSEHDSADESDGGFEGETSTQRSKRKKREKQGSSMGTLTCAARRAATSPDETVANDDGSMQTEMVPDDRPPVLREIVDALALSADEQRKSGTVKELKISLVRTEEAQAPGLDDGAVDPALWRCGKGLRYLEIRWRPGLNSTTLNRIGSLKRLLHLIISDSGLADLPEALGELLEMRSLEVDRNALTTMPSSLQCLAGNLESLSAARNRLVSGALERLAPLEHLVSLKLDHNQLGGLDGLSLSRKPHLVTLSVAHNKLRNLPQDPWGDLVMLQHLNVSANELTELPSEMGLMKEKKLTELLLHENPWSDGKIRNMVENSAVLSSTVLVYLRKRKPTGKKPTKGKAKRKDGRGESDSESALQEQPGPLVDSSEERALESTVPVANDDVRKGKKTKGSAKKLVEKHVEMGDSDDEDEGARQERLAALAEAKRQEVEERRLAAALKKAERENLEQKMKEKQSKKEAVRDDAQKQKEQRDSRKTELAAKRASEEAAERERRSKMTSEELEAEEKAIAAETAQRAKEAAMQEEERKTRAAQQAEVNRRKEEERERNLTVDDTKFKYVFYGGKMHKVRLDSGPNSHSKGGKKGGAGGAQPGQAKGGSGSGGAGAGGGGGKRRENSQAGGDMNFEGSIDVPSDLVGRLIGKAGSTIKELCTSTGARIDIDSKSKGEVVPVLVYGRKQAVEAAVQRIAELLGMDS